MIPSFPLADGEGLLFPCQNITFRYFFQISSQHHLNLQLTVEKSPHLCYNKLNVGFSPAGGRP
jgi:hypothetical protein